MSKLKEWKDPGILLSSIAISNIGDFIYLIAINIIVFQLTGSAAAVAGLWIISPLTNIVTKFWTGSFIDYRSKRKVMMSTYVIRALFISLIPFAPNMIMIYGILIVLSVSNSFFHPASTTYVTIMIPIEKRKRFNSIRAFASSGAFIIGPAIGGTLLYLYSYEITLWINAALFVAAALLLRVLPEKESIDKKNIPALTISQIRSDFTVVKDFVIANRYVSVIYFGFTLIMIFSFAMDTQEVVFTQRIIGLTEIDYSLLVSITGIGSLFSAILLTIFSSKFSLRYMISIGLLMTTTGYIIYAFSWSFLSIVIGFLILGFFNVFLNAGIMTFYQNNVPVEVMGRVTSIYQLIQSIVQVLFILGIGLLGDILSLRVVIATLAILMLITSVIYIWFVLKDNKKTFYLEESH
ncbi:MFS transporter [Sporosarcina sp. BI001-red]|uniref:MFS transporter n=1 Tax=Sporosarcina sp. BI001-red TaxID=2282866 RepID=UPI000E21CA7C|nr:MFS transporter [Sporosarcina sp. BI001-red]REB07362.1 MFS transporter [Sporosarcina sp. BI001-red]